MTDLKQGDHIELSDDKQPVDDSPQTQEIVITERTDYEANHGEVDVELGNDGLPQITGRWMLGTVNNGAKSVEFPTKV